MSKLTQEYEISVWEVSAQEEVKLAIIGANDMLTPARAQMPQLKRNVNGTKSLTFSLYTKYIDEIDGQKKVNPFCDLIHNESRIKLKWKNKWFEFIVKNILEDSENNKNTYTAEDAFIIELSRKGFNIELNTDLENNQGTIIELEKKILENSDWEVDEENSIVGPQEKEDTLVKLTTSKELIVEEKCEYDSNSKFKVISNTFKIPEGATIYSFYSSLYKKDSFFQFYYDENEKYEFDDSGFILKCPIYTLIDCSFNGKVPEGTKNYELTTCKGKRLIRTQKSYYDKVLDKYVSLYQDNSKKEIGCFTETEYITDDFVKNLAANSTEYYTEVGWNSIGDNCTIELYSYPSAEKILTKLNNNKTVESKSFIKINPQVRNDYLFYNTGFDDNKDILKSLYNGKQFVIRLKYSYKKAGSDDAVKKMEFNTSTKRLNSGLKVSLCEFAYDEDGEPEVKKVLFSTALEGKGENVFKKDGNFWTAICTCKDKYTANQLLTANIGIFFSCEFSKTTSIINESNYKKYDFCIEDFQFFEFKEKIKDINDEEELIKTYYLPGDPIDGEARVKYNYFKTAQEYDDADDIEYEYQGYTEKKYEKKYVPNYQQIRTIEEKESNIFNLTQTLCETFEIWADFVVEHDSLGYIKKNSNGNFIKKIVFKPYVGKEKWSGFHYKLNLKSIQRTSESKQITTKTIVKPNSNEFAPNGFCTIAYSDENPSGESFIYDFRYYENQNLINSEKLFEDLYGDKGLYAKLKDLNEQIQEKITQRTDSAAKLLYLEKEKEVLSANETELATLLASNKKQFKTQTGVSYKSFLKLSKTKQDSHLQYGEIAGLFSTIYIDTNELQKVKKEYSEVLNNYKKEKKNYNSLISESKKLSTQKENLILDFETKYAPFIQEGVWISEEYIDHNLYYIDAKAVAASSAMPQATYSIKVLDLSSMEEFKNFDIEVGDKTYITDPEFFGYIKTDDFYTPRRQEVIISETTEDLEEPEKNQITVQNFKTQFEDIFHRITAATQQLKLSEGVYQRASNAFTNQGLDSNMIQESFNSTNFNLVNNTNTWSSSGFVSNGSNNIQNSVKIHDGAISIAQEGEYRKVIDGKGINADYIYAGQLDAGKINIVSELKTNEDQELEYAVTFDKDGLSMYAYENTRKVRLRLGKILEENEYSDELYGLQLYNSEGEQTFRTDSNGDITMTGTINATAGLIGGWGIEEDRLVHYTDENLIDAMISTIEGDRYYVNDYGNNDWRLLLGINGNTANFGVTASGNLFANGVDIRDGNISIGDIFKITSNGGANQAMGYGLNIKLNPENQNQEIVIESDDRVIGIRERRADGKGWTWKTILGDLTNATLGGKPASEYGLTGYGLFTENGLFSGTIYASSGRVGGWELEENRFRREIIESENNKFVFELGFDKKLDNSIPIFTNLNEFFVGPEPNNYVFKGPIPSSEKEILFKTYTNNNFYIGYNGVDLLITEYPLTKEQQNLSDFKVTIISIKSVDGTVDYLEEGYLDSIEAILPEMFYATKEGEKLKLEINLSSFTFLYTYLNVETVQLKLRISALEKTYPTYEHPIILGANVPKSYEATEEIKDWIGDSFVRYIYYKLYNKKDTLTITTHASLTLQIMAMTAHKFFGGIGDLIVGTNSFVRISKEEDRIIYAIDRLGNTKAFIEPSFDQEIDKKFASINSFIGLFIDENDKTDITANIFSIANQNNKSIWKVFLDEKTESDDSGICYESIFSLGNQNYLRDYGVLNFLARKEIDGNNNPSYYSFYFEGQDENDKKKFSCDLGTSEYPWSNLYIQNDLVINGTSWLNKVYPVGSIYMSVNKTNPGTLFGGTWVSWGSGKVPVGVDTSDTIFDKPEETGGNKTISYTPKGSVSGSVSGTVGKTTLTIEQIPAHSHTFIRAKGTAAAGDEKATANSTGEALPNVIGSTGGGKSHTHSFSGTFNSGKFTGTAASISTLQPYITCYMWKRTA